MLGKWEHFEIQNVNWVMEYGGGEEMEAQFPLMPLIKYRGGSESLSNTCGNVQYLVYRLLFKLC